MTCREHSSVLRDAKSLLLEARKLISSSSSSSFSSVCIALSWYILYDCMVLQKTLCGWYGVGEYSKCLLRIHYYIKPKITEQERWEKSGVRLSLPLYIDRLNLNLTCKGINDRSLWNPCSTQEKENNFLKTNCNVYFHFHTYNFYKSKYHYNFT